MTSPFTYAAQQMVLYFAMERGDPSRHMDWDELAPFIEKEWPEFWAAWLLYDADDSDQAYRDFQAVCATKFAELRAADDNRRNK